MKIKVNKTKFKKGVDYNSIDLYETHGGDHFFGMKTTDGNIDGIPFCHSVVPPSGIGMKTTEGNIDGIPLDSKLLKIFDKSYRNNDDVKIEMKSKLLRVVGYMQVACLNISPYGSQVNLIGKSEFRFKHPK